MSVILVLAVEVASVTSVLVAAAAVVIASVALAVNQAAFVAVVFIVAARKEAEVDLCMPIAINPPP